MVIKRTNILGVGVSAINMDLASKNIADWVRNKKRHYVCVSTVHGLIESQRDPLLRDIHNEAGMVTPDGMPLVWLLKMAGHSHADRVYGPDLMLATFEESAVRGYKHYLYGASPATLAKLESNLRTKFPSVQIVGSHSPPYRDLTPDEESQIVNEINDSGADIVWVGLSTPKQERWMAKHRERLNPSVLLGVGAAFDFHAGVTRQAPNFVQRAGFEWLFRLMIEPRRLWRRYFTIVPSFLVLIFAQKTGLKRFGSPFAHTD